MTPTTDPSLRPRLMWVTGARLLVTTLLLGSTAFFYLRGNLSRYPHSMQAVFTTIAVAYALSAIEAMVLRTGKRLRELAYVHVVLDQCLWTAIVYLSGGASSGATSFYGLTVLVGAVLVGLRGAAFAGVFGFSLYGLLCIGFLTHVILPPADQHGYPMTRDEIGYPLLLNALAITVVSMLAGYLSERLRQTGGALEVARRRYTEAERLAELGRISAWLAHEIRNPLGSISGSIEMLREGETLTPEEKKLCDIVSREVIRLNDLVSDMVDLSKTREPTVENVDVGQLAREVVELATRSRGAEDHHIEYVEEDGGGGKTPLLAKCDPAQMRQVLWNLVRNALQASPSRGVVRVGVGSHDDKATVWVEDDGAGIDDEAKGRIFDAFYTTRAHGAGIGLAVVKRIIDDHEKHGAAIMVDNASAGKGARFKISLSRVL